MLSVFIGILTVLMVIVSILLILIVLMQRPKQEGLGAAFGGGMMDSLAGAHTTDVLQRGTVWLATIFLGASILLAVLKTRELKAQDPGELLPSNPPAESALPTDLPSLSNLPMPELEKAAEPAQSEPAKSEPAKAEPVPAPQPPAPSAPSPSGSPSPAAK